MNRIAIFFFYDKHGIVDDYVPYLLGNLRDHVEKIVFVSNGKLTEESEAKARSVSDDFFIRENIGFDVWAYKEAIERVGYEALQDYDELILLNHTCYGPIFPFAELFSEMESRSDDFWGVSIHKALTPNPFTGFGTLPEHIQSHFIAVRRRLVASPDFKKYWDSMPPINSYDDSVRNHESKFTRYFIKLGYKCSAYIDPNEFKSPYPVFIEVTKSIDVRCPLLKRKLFFYDSSFHQNAGIDLPAALDKIQAESDYDQSLIWQNIVREAKPRALVANAGLLRVMGDHAEQIREPTNLRVALCLHIERPEIISRLSTLVSRFPAETNVIITTGQNRVMEQIEASPYYKEERDRFHLRKTRADSTNGVGSLFTGCRDIFLGDRFDLVCRLQDTDVKFDLGLPDAFRGYVEGNLANSAGYVRNVIGMFTEQPWVGLAFPPAMRVGTVSWPNYRWDVENLLATMEIKSPVDEITLAPQMSMFWFRPAALRKLFAMSWSWEEFEDSSGEIVAQSLVYVAADARYTVMQIMCDRLVPLNFLRLNLLADGQVASPTIRQASQVWVEAAKRSIKFRAPKMAAALRPLYRTALPALSRLGHASPSHK